jgi:hypothetical protein
MVTDKKINMNILNSLIWMYSTIYIQYIKIRIYFSYLFITIIISDIIILYLSFFV